MKLLSVLTVVASATAVAIPPSEQVPLQNGQEEIFLIESAPGQRQWVTEDQKWQLRREGVNFLDITDERAAGIDAANSVENGSPAYPDSLDHVDEVKALTSELSKKVIEDHLTQFTSFHTRYFKSKDGIRSATWLFEQVQKILDSSGASATGATVSKFNHPWGQFSVIARIPGRSNDTVVIGAHQDSINLFLPSILAAPGADDDGSGTVTILEALRVFLKDPAILHGKASNTVEFHWYSAEEGGLLGSQAVFKEYRTQERTIKAMLQQDMTGYVQGTINAGQPESVGVITDYVDPGLTEFIKRVITEYCDIPWVLTRCGYACSDHASASRYGYPSAFVIESAFEYSDKRIHTTEDKIEYLSFDHMLQHAKMTIGYAYELAFAQL